MQYIYNIVEVAALWAGVDFSVVRGRMDSADTAVNVGRNFPRSVEVKFPTLLGR